MWVLPRASVPLKTQAPLTSTFHACYATLEIASSSRMNRNGYKEHPPHKTNKSLFLKVSVSGAFGSRKNFMGKHSFCCQAGAKSSGEEDDDLEDGVSEHETSSADVIEGKDATEVISEADVSESEEIEDDVALEKFLSCLEVLGKVEEYITRNIGEHLGHSFTRQDVEKVMIEEFVKVVRIDLTPKERDSSGLLMAIMDFASTSVQQTLDTWVAEGPLTNKDVSTAMLGLLRRKKFVTALELAQCVELQRVVEFGERLQRHILPTNFNINRVKNWEQIMNKKKRSISTYNWLLVYCKRTNNMEKTERVLSLMEEEHVKPNHATYNLLIDLKGESNDVTGMEKIVETMKALKVEPDDTTRVKLAWQYTRLGFNEKAEEVLRKLEVSRLIGKRPFRPIYYPVLITIYAILGNANDVERVWKACLPNPKNEERRSAFYAWLRLKNIRKARKVYCTFDED